MGTNGQGVSDRRGHGAHEGAEGDMDSGNVSDRELFVAMGGLFSDTLDDIRTGVQLLVPLVVILIGLQLWEMFW